MSGDTSRPWVLPPSAGDRGLCSRLYRAHVLAQQGPEWVSSPWPQGRLHQKQEPEKHLKGVRARRNTSLGEGRGSLGVEGAG